MRAVRHPWAWVLLCATHAFAQTDFVFQEGASTVPGYSVEDVNITLSGDSPDPWDPDANHNGVTNFIDGWPSDVLSLIRFDLPSSEIPTSATVSAASLILFIEDTGAPFSAYALRTSWTETQVTWNQRQSGVPWAASGAQGDGTDRNSASLGNWQPAAGAATLALNAAGVAAVQGWVSDPATNHGLALEFLGGSDGTDFASCSAATATRRPILRVTYDGGTTKDFQNGVLPTGAYAGCTDATIAHGANPAFLNRDRSGLLVAGGATPTRSLLKFDLGAIPPGASVSSAVLQFRLERALSASPTFHRVLTSWTETGATWTTRDGVVPWSTAGGAPGVDYDSVPFLSPTGLAEGAVQLDLTGAGLALVQGWVDDPSSNAGMFIRTPGSGFSFQASDSEFSVVSVRPALLVQAVVPFVLGPDGGAQPIPGTGSIAPLRYNVSCGCRQAEGAVPAVLVWAWLAAVRIRRRTVRTR